MTKTIAFGLRLATMTLAAAASAGHGHDNQVSIRSGALQGSVDGDVLSFKGIPYAAPPIGELRWRPPQPPIPWNGIRVANKVGAICPQKYQAQDAGVGPPPISEDCLTLNVYAPAGAKALPVMFWIHGGGFVNGSGTAALYDGSALARQGVIVVTINYRLGRLGFFAHPALSASAGNQPVGNFALMDMIAALKWTQANIARFGGDPKNVTLFGESAGGIAVNDLMVSRKAKGLFGRAIVESGLGRETYLTLSAAERSGETFAAALGHPKATTAELRQLSVDEIVNAGDPDILAGGTSMIDGKILTVGALAGFRAGKEAAVPYIVGWNSLEFPAPAAMAVVRFGPQTGLTPTRLTSIKNAYPDGDSYERNLVSDLIFVEPAVRLASLHASRGYPTWVYQFSVLPKRAPALLRGAPHASERQYVFQTLNTSPYPTDANDAKQAQLMSSYWVDFAKAGDPNGAGRPSWPSFSSTTGSVIDFTNDGTRKTNVPRAKAIAELGMIYER